MKAKEIADKYFPEDAIKNGDLELDILRYLEWQYKNWMETEKEKQSPKYSPVEEVPF